MTQLVSPNLSTKGVIGRCLEYAREAFGAPAVEPNAWTAWLDTKFKHADHNIPSDVAVPCWFSYFENGENLGHVVISVPGQGFYSSPWKQGTDHAVLPSIEEVERIYGVVYVGWSEDISNVRVVGDSMDRGAMGAAKFLAVRQTGDITDAEYETYKDDFPGWIQYLTRVQSEHHLAPYSTDDVDALNAKIASLSTELAVPAPAPVTPADDLVTQVKENNSLLSQLLAKLGSIFK